jgi:diacylglycerol kinase (ATP)
MVTETNSADRKPSFKKVHVIANPAAGRDVPILGVLNRAFKNADIDWDLFLTKKAGDAHRLAQEAVKAGADLVAVYGGDGSVMEAATGLMGADLPLAILPGGTANVMSVELGIPGDLPSAVNLICGSDHKVRTVDMGQVRGQMFILRITTGLSAEMTKNTEREDKNRLGVLAYALSWLRAVPTTPASRYQLTLDGEQVELEGVTCVIANSASLGLPGLTLAKTADISDGLLDVFVFRSSTVNELLSIAANAVIDADLIPHWQVREVTVTAEPPQTVECDGEVLDPTPLTAQIVPQAVRVLVPTAPPMQAQPNP